MLNFLINREFNKKASSFIKSDVIHVWIIFEYFINDKLIRILNIKKSKIKKLNLKKKIDILHEKKVITNEQYNMLNIFRKIRNEFTHDLRKYYFYNFMNMDDGLWKELMDTIKLKQWKYKEETKKYTSILENTYTNMKYLEKMAYRVELDVNFYIRYNILVEEIYNFTKKEYD